MRMSSALLLDRLLRSRGWRIHSRPKSGPILWRKGGAVLPQEQVVKMVMKERDGPQAENDAPKG